jgi:hypothetical protein
MKPQDFIDAVDELNQELPEEVYAEGIYYEYSTDGFIDMVDFAHFNIFCSGFDTEMRVEDVSEIKEYLIRKRNEFINTLVKVKG